MHGCNITLPVFDFIVCCVVVVVVVVDGVCVCLPTI